MLNKKRLSLMVLLGSLFVFSSCENPYKPADSSNSDSVYIRNPGFITSPSRSAYNITLSDAGTFYYAFYCPLLVSFDSDETFIAGDTFMKVVLGQNVVFETSLTEKIVSYAGKSSDNNISITIQYNRETNRIDFNQIIIIKPKISDIQDQDVFLETKFTSEISESNILHALCDYYAVRSNCEINKNNGNNIYAYGKSEFYTNGIYSGFCTTSQNYSPNNKYEVFALENAEEIEDIIMGFQRNKPLSPYYAMGICKNGSITIYSGLHLLSIGSFETKEEAQTNCPWTLF